MKPRRDSRSRRKPTRSRAPARPPGTRRRPRAPLRSGPATIGGDTTAAQRWPDVSRVLKSQPWESLGPHLIAAGADPAAALPRLRRYCELLLQWNRKVSNLISRNDESRIVSRHVSESLEPAGWLKSANSSSWIDFGSGAGLPALPLAIAGVGPRWTLVESRRTKTLFMRKAIEEIAIEGVSVILARLEDLVAAGEHAGAYDGFTSRATLVLGPTLELAASLVRPGGSAFLWKGSRREAEMAADGSWREHWDFDRLLAIGDGATTVVRFVRK